ncbi:MAG: Rieske 2Fe-2S domain-containing protein [bacterium]|nr:Rieske 2Fe-2S domain-containing protein [bacterium]
MKIQYEKIIPYPFDVVLSQYFDYEHIAYVHPDSLGEYRLVENNGDVIVYDQIWPGRFWRRRSRVRQTFYPPGEIEFEFIAGQHKGVRVYTRLSHHSEGTLVDETYFLPGLPDWPWLRDWIRPSVMRSVERIWEEDLRVEVCYQGWPGVPGSAPPAETPAPLADESGRWVVLAEEDSLRSSPASVHVVSETEIVVFSFGEKLFALEARCPHAGGPLALGAVNEGAVTCPWHGACFEIASGRRESGPVRRDLIAYPLRRVNGTVEIFLPG